MVIGSSKWEVNEACCKKRSSMKAKGRRHGDFMWTGDAAG